MNSLEAAVICIQYALEDGVPAKYLRQIVADEANELGLHNGLPVSRNYRGMRRPATISESAVNNQGVSEQ
jgi:hypothetical protein